MRDWENLEEQCKKCEKCGLCRTRSNVVFGVGRKDTDIVFVGEGPGEQEDRMGEPFVGAAGHLLDDMLSIIDLNRKNIYICNVVKCRPPQNRDPSDEEQIACAAFLENQLHLLQPKIIICLGRVAAKRLIRPDFRITSEHGKWFCHDGIWKMAMYHPSALLRDLSKRPETFDDLLEIRRKLKEVNADI